MTKSKKLKVALAKIERLKIQIAKKRDELRSAISDVVDIVESMNEAIDSLEEGQRCFENAADSMSKFL